MYIIACTEATPRFEWEVEVFLTNLQSFDYDNIILLFCGGEKKIVEKIKHKYGVRCEFYADERPLKRYPTSNRSYSWIRFLKEFPEMEKETFFYVDTDIILRDKIDFNQFVVSEKKWIGSDCSSYLQPSYIKNKGMIYYETLLKTIDLSDEIAEKFEGASIGAQWLISQPKSAFWQKVYEDSESLFLTFRKLEFLTAHESKDNQFQSWCADMWAILWNTAYFNINVDIENQFSFSWSTNDKEEWGQHFILHNAGVIDSSNGLFFKGDWNVESPIGKDIKVDPTKCSHYYVEAIKKVGYLGGSNV